MSKTRSVIDATCSDSMCSTKGTYKKEASCLNCGWEGAIKQTKGHSRSGRVLGPDCPRCECRDLSFGDFIEDSP